MARRSYTVGAPGAKATASTAEALAAVEAGLPVVLVAADAAQLGAVLAASPDHGGARLLLAAMVGDPADPAVTTAAREMAAELWPARPGPPA
jgi:hypothetical protein